MFGSAHVGSSSLKSVLSRSLQLALRRFGYRLQRLDEGPPFVDVRGHSNDPRAIYYWSRSTPVLIDAPLDWGRGLLAFPLARDGNHPFVRAVAAAMSTRARAAAIRERLCEYYAAVQPTSAAEYLGIPALVCPALDAVPPWAFVFPWVSQSLQERVAQKEAEMNREDLEPSPCKDMPLSLGWKDCGPSSPELLDHETQRLSVLMESVERDGPRRNDGPSGDILGVVLRRGDGQWRWRVGSGHHRAAVLSALGHSHAAVRVVAVVNREEASVWPQVQSGLYSEDAARRLFDTVFDAALPPVFRPWERSPLSQACRRGVDGRAPSDSMSLPDVASHR